MTDWSTVRAEFPALARWTFLNTATYGQMPRRATEAVARHLARRDELACHDFLTWFDDVDGIRESIGRLIHCRGEDIAFRGTASEGLSLLVGGIDWKPGDRMVTLENEFPNNLYWPAMLRERQVEAVETPWERFYEAITPRTRLVALSTVNYSTGLRVPLAEVASYLGERGILLYVDGTQSVGALELDVTALDLDFVAVNAYKWMLSPNGAGFLYVSPRVRHWLAPNVVGWRSDFRWRQVDSLHHGAPEFSKTAEKYEGAMLPFPSIYGMGAVVDMMLELGPAAIEARVMGLAAYARRRLGESGARVVADERKQHESPIVAARWEGCDMSLLAKELKAKGVLVAARHGNLRVSAHFYNTEADVEELIGTIREIFK